MAKDAREYYEIIERAENGESGYYTINIDNLTNYLNGISGDVYSFEFSGNHDAYITAESYLDYKGVVYFYLRYHFTDDSNNYISGETYASYSYSAVLGLDSIEFAYTKLYDNDGSWDCIPTNYKLSNNMEYNKAVNKIVIFLAISIEASSFCALFVFFIILIKKKEQEESQKKEEKETVVKVIKVCPYCGGSNFSSNNVCNNCGSTEFKTITLKRKNK